MNRMARVANEIRASHQYHRRSLQKGIRLSYIFMCMSLFYIAATIIEITNIGEWTWLAMITVQRCAELVLLTTFIWALETDSSYAPRAERQKIRGPVGRDLPDPPAERDLYKDRDAEMAGASNGGGGNDQRDRDREAQRAYNDRYKSSGVVNSGPLSAEISQPYGYNSNNNTNVNNNHRHHGGHSHHNQRPTGNTFVTGGHSLAISVNQEWVPHPSLASPAGSGLYGDRSYIFRAPNIKGGGATQLNNELHDSGLLTAANVNAQALQPSNNNNDTAAIDATNTRMSSVENATIMGIGGNANGSANNSIAGSGTTGGHNNRRSGTYTMTLPQAHSSHPYAVPDIAPSSLLQVPSSAA
jgi:hypothetical protein